MTYAAPVSIDACALVPPWGIALGEINKTMEGFGLMDKIIVRSEIGVFTIQSEKELTFDELEKVRAKAETIARETQPTWDFRFGRLERV